MKANELLLWMSARREGAWQQFRTAVEQLHLSGARDEQTPAQDDANGDRWNGLPLHQDLRLNLERYGHVEFFDGAGVSAWRVTPPSLAATRYGDRWLAVLAGARTTQLMERID